MSIQQAFALWLLEIWDPDKMNFLRGSRRRQMRLFYRAKGIVLHDRLLNQRPIL